MPDNYPRSSYMSPQDFLDRLQRFPDLQAEVAALLDIVENVSGDASKADDTVGRVAQEL